MIPDTAIRLLETELKHQTMGNGSLTGRLETTRGFEGRRDARQSLEAMYRGYPGRSSQTLPTEVMEAARTRLDAIFQSNLLPKVSFAKVASVLRPTLHGALTGSGVALPCSIAPIQGNHNRSVCPSGSMWGFVRQQRHERSGDHNISAWQSDGARAEDLPGGC